LKAGTFVGYSANMTGTMQAVASAGSSPFTLMFYTGVAWNVPTLADYRSFPVPTYAAGFSASVGEVGFGFSVFGNPFSSPPQFGETTGVVLGGVREGPNVSGGGGLSYAGGPLKQISDRDIVRTLLAIPWPPGAGVALVLRS